MCMFKSPKVPKAPDPIVIAPEQEKKIELNPAVISSKKKRAKKIGTRSLQIPMGGTGGGSGLNIPG